MELLKCSKIYLPYYLCPEIDEFLSRNSIMIQYYSIKEDLTPALSSNEADSAVLVVNHFGLFTKTKLKMIIGKYQNVIIDNCAAFFCPEIKGCLNVYSCRKFFGVPDGAYIIGPDASANALKYPRDISSDTSSFLLKRIEKGCSEVYNERILNELRINNSGILRMSKLTESLLNSLDYNTIKEKRRNNFMYACQLYRPFNLLNLDDIRSDYCVPLFYPLVVKDIELVNKLQQKQIYTGRRWISVHKKVNSDSFEAFLSDYMVPIPIDQRYNRKELDYCFEVFRQIFP
jgi:hypothetical protein